MGLFSRKPNVGKMEAKRDVEGLIKVLPYEEYYVERAHAAHALGEIGDRRAVEPLIAALEDRMSFVRRAAAEALGEIGDSRVVEPLIAARKDSDWDVRSQATEALAKIRRKTL